ncbi:GNAT family N-acetyltransferase, partial [Pseudomonas gessardii]
MPNPQDLSALPLPAGPTLNADESDGRLTLTLAGQPLVRLRLARGEALHLHLQNPGEVPSVQALWAAAYWLFAREPERQQLFWHLEHTPDEALRSGLLLATDVAGQLRCERTLFWQLPQPWLGLPSNEAYPQQMIISTGKRHPARAPKPRGEVYRRFDIRLGAWISLRTLEIDVDLARFNRWQNSTRVANFWQESGSLEQHRDYLQKLDADPHTLTLIGCFDDEPFAYFEAYWA